MAFFLESTFVGLFFFGWDRLTRMQHLLVTFLVALGSNLSALWILIANGWMNNPVGAEFNFETMRMELTSICAVVFNPVAQVKFVHTVSAGYVTASMFVLGDLVVVSAARRERRIRAALVSAIAAAFGLASAVCVIVLGDESRLYRRRGAADEDRGDRGDVEDREGAGRAQARRRHRRGACPQRLGDRMPYVMGLIGTRSVTKQIPGIDDIRTRNRERVVNGIRAAVALDALRMDRANTVARATFDATKQDLGFGLLLKRYVDDVRDATPAMIDRAVADTIPRVRPMFWAFRAMVALGCAMLALFGLAFLSTLRSRPPKRWLLHWAFWMLPVPWIACELGWFVAEYGRQPWTIAGVLPTHLSVSNLSVGSLYGSLAGFVGFYTLLLVAEIYLMQKFARQGPGSLATGRYVDETPSHTAALVAA